MSEKPNILAYEAKSGIALDDGELVLWEHHWKRALSASETYRITNRRVFVQLKARQKGRDNIHLRDLCGFEVIFRPWNRNISVHLKPGLAQLKSIPSDAGVDALLLMHCPRLGRLRRPIARRSNKMPAVQATDWPLLPDEKLLWTGKPHPWNTIDAAWMGRSIKILAWAMLPAAVLYGRHFPVFGKRLDVSPLFVGAAILWLGIVAYSFSLGALRHVLRRSRTDYALTDQRLIVRNRMFHRTTIASTFLYRMSGAQLSGSLTRAGRASIMVEGVVLENIDGAEQVYTSLLQAIHAAGGPIEQPREDNVGP